MTRIATALAVAATIANLPASAQTPSRLTLTVRGAPAGTTITVGVVGDQPGAGTTTTGTSSGGTATMPVNVQALGAARAITVHVAACAAQRVDVWLAAPGRALPATGTCERRAIGTIDLSRTQTATIQLPDRLTIGGSKAPRAALIAGGGAGAAALAIAIASAGHTESASNGVTPPVGSASTFQGRYTGSARATTNTCGLSAATLVSAELTVTDAANAIATWTHTDTTLGVTFSFTNVRLDIPSPTQASFTATVTQAVGGASYSVTDAASIANTTMTLTQTLNRSDGACVAVYQMTLTRG